MNRDQLIPLVKRAARKGDTAKIAGLVKAGADLNCVDEAGGYSQTTALHVAALSPLCSAASLRGMIELGANPNIICPASGSAPLLAAAQIHALDKLAVLREMGADIHHVAKSGMNVVVCAAYGPAVTMPRVLQVIADWGISLDTQSDYGESALSVLSRRGLFQSVQYLLNRGAGPRPLSWTASHFWAAGVAVATSEFGKISSDKLELKDGWGRTPLHLAALSGNLEAFDWLVAHGANPKAQWRCQQNALHVAAIANQNQSISKLLDLGLDVDWSDEFGSAPLERALESDATDAARVLLIAGARLDAENSVQDRPVHFARSISAFELLLAAGCDLNVVSGQGSWPLHDAAESGNTDLVAYLLEHGAQVDLTSTGATALHAAAHPDNLATITTLLDAGADPNARDVDGCTPLFSAQSPEVAKLLLDRGGDPSASDQCGFTASRWIEDPDILVELKPKICSKT